MSESHKSKSHKRNRIKAGGVQVLTFALGLTWSAIWALRFVFLFRWSHSCVKDMCHASDVKLKAPSDQWLTKTGLQAVLHGEFLKIKRSF